VGLGDRFESCELFSNSNRPGSGRLRLLLQVEKFAEKNDRSKAVILYEHNFVELICECYLTGMHALAFPLLA